MKIRAWIGLLAAGTAVLTPIGPATAQSMNYYGNGSSFYVPLYTSASPNDPPVANPTAQNSRYISLSLSGITQRYLMDTGSLGLVTTLGTYYNPGSDPLLGSGSITYSTSGVNPTGNIYLTNVTINGSNGQSVVARVPVLASSTTTTSQMGIGFDRGGITFSNGTPLSSFYNPNPLLGLVSGPGVSTMQPGYIIGFNGFQSLGLGPGVLLGLTNQNTSGFSLVQLTSAGGGLLPGCTTAGFNCLPNWNGQTATVSVGGVSLGPMSVLPDSGIGYMLIQYPNGGVTTGPGTCAAGQAPANNCVPAGTVVQIVLPGQTTASSYSFTVGSGTNPSEPFGVQVFQGANEAQFSNLGRTFFENLTYLYDPINGFVGYASANVTGTTVQVVPLLALQGNLTLPAGFASSYTTFLMSNVALTQNGSGTMTGSIVGPGGLALQAGNLTLGGASSYVGGTVVNGGTLTIGNTGSIVGNLLVNSGGAFVNNGTVSGNGLLTVNSGASFINNGTYNTPIQFQLNQGSFANNGLFNASLANTGTATNTGTLTGAVINGNTGTFSNSGTVSGNVANMGTWNNSGTVGGNFANSGVLAGTGTIQGNLVSSGVISPGLSTVGTINVSGSLAMAAGSLLNTEVFGGGSSDRIAVASAATIGGAVQVTALPGLTFAPSTRYTIVSAAGGLTGTFSALNELYPFLLSSLSYDANNAYLTLQLGGFAAAAVNSNQYAVGAVLDANAPNASGDFLNVLSSLAVNTLTDSQAQSVLQQLGGSNYAGFSSAMVQGAQLFMNNFASQTGGGSPARNRVALAEACDVACDTVTAPKWGAWGGALGGLGTIGANQPVGGVTYNAGGVAVGLDRAITDSFRVGVTTGYSTGTQWVSGYSGVGRTDTWQAGLYAGYARDKVYADVVAGYAYSWNQMWRNLVLPGLQPRTALGQTGANQWYGQLETGYRFDLGTAADAFVTPFARLQAYSGTQAGFTETGAQSLNLTVGQQTTNSLRSVLGAQFGGAMDVGWREKLALQLRLGWSHEYADVGRPVTATLAGAPAMPFTTWGVSPQRDGVVIGLAANTAVAEATALYLRYEGNISGQDSAHAITGGVRMTW